MKNFNLFKFIFVTTSFAYWALFNCSSNVVAQYYSQSEGNPKIIVDKQIRPITDSLFYENISKDQKIFNEGDSIEFKIVVENTGNETLYNVKFIDSLPKYLNLLFFPGIYNKTDNNIVNVIGTLEPGQRKEYLIRAKIINLPTSTNSFDTWQQINKVKAESDQVSDYDESKYYVSLKSIPTTGSNDIGFKTISLFGLICTGIYIRKLSRGY